MPTVGQTHHLRLGSSYLLLHPNSYFKRSAPVFGARFAGGDHAYDNLAFWQHWGQSCWIGGMGEESWEDDSMYHTGIGVDTSQHDLVALARGIAPGGTNFGLDAGKYKYGFRVFDDELYAVQLTGSGGSTVWKYAEATDTWSKIKTFVSGIQARSSAVFASDLYVGTNGTKIRKYDGGAWTTINKPKNRRESPYMMAPYRGRLYVGFGRRLYRLRPNDKWDGNAVFFDGKGIDRYDAWEYHQGFLYMVSRNGHVVRTDGNATFDIHQFDGHGKLIGLKSYDGKLFIAALEWYDDDDEGEYVLYQMSGAAVTELRRWGRIGYTHHSHAMTVIARRLFYGATDLLGMKETGDAGFGLAVYDAREDAHSLFAVERDTVTYADAANDAKDYLVDDVVYWGDRIFISVRGHGIFKIDYTHRDLERDIANFDNSWTGAIAVGNEEGGVLVSSDFDAGTPGLQKIWRKIQVTADLIDASVKVHVGYSTDGGRTWTDAGEVTKTGAGTRYTKDFYLQDVKSERFKYKLQLETTDPNYSPFVRSVVVSFLPHPEPNWAWSFTAVLNDTIEQLDGTVLSQDVDALKAALEAAYRDSALVYFQDVDGTEWVNEGGEKPGVLIEDIVFSAPVITHENDGAIEYTVQVQLIEAAETYT